MSYQWHMVVQINQGLLWEHINFLEFFILFYYLFLLKGNCFTESFTVNSRENWFISCWFLPYNSVNQPLVYIYSLPLEPLSHTPPHPTPLGCHRVLFFFSFLRQLHSCKKFCNWDLKWPLRPHLTIRKKKAEKVHDPPRKAYCPVPPTSDMTKKTCLAKILNMYQVCFFHSQD